MRDVVRRRLGEVSSVRVADNVVRQVHAATQVARRGGCEIRGLALVAAALPLPRQQTPAQAQRAARRLVRRQAQAPADIGSQRGYGSARFG